MASKPRAFAKVFLPALPPPPLLTAPVFSRRPTTRGAGAAAMSAAAAAPAQAPRKWEGLVDEALEREVLGACLDQAPERRRIREAFKNVQLSIGHCLFKGQYSGIGTKESYERNSRGVEIFSKCWFPENRCMRAIVCLCHGYGDTCTFFLDGVARKIASAGYGVFALDYPGFGLSEGLHGYIPSFDTLVDDVAEHFTKVKGNPEYRGLPSFLFGQSMGGAVALKVHFKQPNEWNGAILVAPMCKIADDVVPPWPIQQVLIFMAKLLPKEKLVPQKDLAELAFKEKKKQEQCSFNVISYKDKPRLRTAVEMLKTTQEIERRLEEVSLPLIILHGEADLVTDPAVSKALYEKAKSQDKKLCLYKGAYHAILEGEPDETIFHVLGDIISWLDQHSAREEVSKALARGGVSLCRAEAMICKLILGLDEFFFWELGLDDLKTGITARSTMGHSHYGCCWEPARTRGAVIMKLGVLSANSFAV